VYEDNPRTQNDDIIIIKYMKKFSGMQSSRSVLDLEDSSRTNTIMILVLPLASKKSGLDLGLKDMALTSTSWLLVSCN